MVQIPAPVSLVELDNDGPVQPVSTAFLARIKVLQVTSSQRVRLAQLVSLIRDYLANLLVSIALYVAQVQEVALSLQHVQPHLIQCVALLHLQPP